MSHTERCTQSVCAYDSMTVVTKERLLEPVIDQREAAQTLLWKGVNPAVAKLGINRMYRDMSVEEIYAEFYAWEHRCGDCMVRIPHDRPRTHGLCATCNQRQNGAA